MSPSEVLHLYRRGALSEDEFMDAVSWAAEPPTTDQWKDVLGKLTMVFGVLLIVSGIILFGAYNWESLPRLAKLGLLQILLTGFWLFSRLRPLDSNEANSLLWGASLLVGAHMAVFGQVYQTGADSYTLFLAWSLLILPWCLISRSNLLWLTELVLFNLAFGLYWDQVVAQGFPTYAVANAVLNATLATAWGWAQKSQGSWLSPEIRNLTIACGLIPLTGAGCWGPFEGELYLVCTGLAAVFLGILYRNYRDEFPPMALLAFCGLALSISIAIRVFIELDELGLLLIGLSIIGLLTPTAGWLRRVHERAAKRPIPDDPEKAPPVPTTPLEVLQAQGILRNREHTPTETEAPLQVGCLTALGAWIAALFLLLFLALTVTNSEQAMGSCGLLLWCATIFHLRSQPSEFGKHLSFALHLAGGLMATYGLSHGLYVETIGLLSTAFVLVLGSFFGLKDNAARGLFGFGLVVIGSLLSREVGGGIGMSVWVLTIGAAVTMGLSHQKGWLLSHRADSYRPTIIGGSNGFLLIIGLASFNPDWLGDERDLVPWLLVLGSALLTAYAAFRARMPLPVIGSFLLLDILTVSSPGFAASVLIFVLSMQGKNRDLLVLSVFSVLVFGIQYYYNLELSFLLKSVTLIASGLLLLTTKRLLKTSETSHAL